MRRKTKLDYTFSCLTCGGLSELSIDDNGNPEFTCKICGESCH